MKKMKWSVLAAAGLAIGTAQAAPVAIDSLTVETVNLTVTVDGDGTYKWGGHACNANPDPDGRLPGSH